MSEFTNVTSGRRPYIPRGCDKQGRHPEAAHAASEIDDDEPRNARPLHCYLDEYLAEVGMPPAIVTALALVIGIICIVGTLHWWLA